MTPPGEMRPSPSEGLDSFAAARRLASRLEDSDDAEVQSERMEDEPGIPQFPGYLVERELGRGTGGVVYSATISESGRPVAIKLFRADLGDSAEAARIWCEIQYLSKLRLTCIPLLIDYGLVCGRLYVVTDRIEGVSLVDHCASKSLGRDQRVELLARVSDAVQALHEQGVLHRDIKPENVLITAAGTPVLVDLGLATPVPEALGREPPSGCSAAGTPSFMSPEQARGDSTALSTRSDVYSIGAVAYLLLAGAPPHDLACPLPEALHRIAEREPRDPRQLDPSIPRPLASILRRATARSPSDRYSSAAALAADLRRWRAGDRPEAMPQTAFTRLVRFGLRRPVLSSAILSVATSLAIIGVSMSLVTWRYGIPHRVELDVNGQSVARLVSRGGGVLHLWDAKIHEGISSAFELSGPGERLAVVGFSNSAPIPHSNELCAFDVLSPDEPVWSSGDGPPRIVMPPPISKVEGDRFEVSWAFGADVFPDVPGDEVVAGHTHVLSSPTCIRVYDRHGAVRFQAWHDGHLSSGYWLPKPRLLVCCGVNSETRTQNRVGGDSARSTFPVVVFAVEVALDSLAEEWIRTTDGLGTHVPRWYRCLLPLDHPSLGRMHHTAVLEPPPVDRDPQAWIRLSLHLDRAPSAGIGFILDASGVEDRDARIVNSNYEARFGEGFPTLELGEFPGRADTRVSP